MSDPAAWFASTTERSVPERIATPLLAGARTLAWPLRDERRPSVGPRAPQDCSESLPKDHEVERQRPVLDVAKVDPHRVVPGQVGATAHLPQASETRLHQEATMHVEPVAFHLAGQRGSRADE